VACPGADLRIALLPAPLNAFDSVIGVFFAVVHSTRIKIRSHELFNWGGVLFCLLTSFHASFSSPARLNGFAYLIQGVLRGSSF
jgi:hypothetical protein